MSQSKTVGGLLPTHDRNPLPKSGFRGWLRRGGRLDDESSHGHEAHPWYLVLWLTGVDYFSTLGYQPGIALLAAGTIAPIATAILLLVTLFCALPVYAQVAKRSYAGQGSIAMLENLMEGWWGKVVVLSLLGFAATDFVITMTLSAADAAQHAIENPYMKSYLGHAQIELTIGLLLLLALVFLKGFQEAIGLATMVAIPYLVLNLVVLFRCMIEIFHHPEYFPGWKAALEAKGDWTQLMIAAALVFPRLALGLSGFETGVSVMPLIRGSEQDKHSKIPRGRIANTRKMLAAAALIMSGLLIASSFATTLLVPPEAYKIGGEASGRAIAWLAHHYLGNVFGTVYDVSTILILWFAGASAMAGLLHLIPRYLPRFGMAPHWVSYARPLVLVLFSINVLVTLVFKANVEAQAGAYATGVLVLMLSAAFAAALALWKENRPQSVYCWGVCLVFLYTLIENIRERPDGLIISSIFVFLVLAVSAFSRLWRSFELRVTEFEFADQESAGLWEGVVGKKVHMVPYRTPKLRDNKSAEIRRLYSTVGPLAFVHVHLMDNRSEFIAKPVMRVRREGEHYVIDITRAIAVANTIAYLSELMDPISIFLGLSRKNLMTQALQFLLFGEGETGLMVYAILLRYWDWTPHDDIRPRIFLMSD
ncbi:MAG TPA: hypothetical protein VM120_29235 [Bryobacteraceae bacterium]|nr:hypothetical protein [Bryobacteraceae bacterium]